MLLTLRLVVFLGLPSLLGNANLQTTLIYAKRITHALNDAVQKMWQDEASAKEASSKLKLVTSK